MPFTISTRCPSCGAELEYQAGCNAVRCSYCGSAHVITGRGRTLSYYFPDRTTAKQAVTAAVNSLNHSGGHWTTKEATLFFIPYYHFIAGELSWALEGVKPDIASGDGGGFLGGLMRDARGNSFSVFEDDAVVLPKLERRFELNARHIDRTLLALGAPGLNSPTLGLRPEVLKLKLFEQKEVRSRGSIAPIRGKLDEYREKGYAGAGDDAPAERAIFGKTESLIYSPFWTIEVTDGREVALCVVDGISGEVLNPKAPLSLLDELIGTKEQKFDVAALRPLKCPDCDADLPVQPDDLVFFCPSCLKAWNIHEDHFTQVRYAAVHPETGPESGMELFPFWSVEVRVTGEGRELNNKFDLDTFSPGLIVQPRAEDKSVPLRFFIPAFGIRNLKVLSRLASGFTRRQPIFKEDEPKACLRGCMLSPEDSLAIAPLILFSIAPKENRRLVKFVMSAKVETLGCELLLIPFSKRGLEYIDAIFGWTMPVAAVS